MVTPFPEKKSGFPFVKIILAVAVIGAAIHYGPRLLGKGGADGTTAGGGPAGGPPVSVATVIAKPVTNWSQFSGILQAVNSVEVRPRVSGQIMAIHFEDGAEVKKGQPLFTIDPRPYEAALISAKGALKQAESTLARAKKLSGSKAISASELEVRQSAYDQALGNYKTADVNLEYTHIAAPISGKISRAEITVGNIVEAGGAAPVLASIVTLSPIYASFDVDESTFVKTIQGVPAAKLKTVPVEVVMNNQRSEPIAGTIHSFDNQITPGSGTIRVRAKLANRDGLLIPGLYAQVRLGSADESDAILINPTAVQTDQSKKFVMIAGEDGKAQYREVTLGGVTEGLQIITSGLKPGEKIIVNGLQRVRPDAPFTGTEVDMTTLQPLNPPADAKPADGTAPAATEAKPADAEAK